MSVSVPRMETTEMRDGARDQQDGPRACCGTCEHFEPFEPADDYGCCWPRVYEALLAVRRDGGPVTTDTVIETAGAGFVGWKDGDTCGDWGEYR